MLTVGAKLGRYEIRSHLGAGGMGEVYLAQDTTELERRVAIKVLPAEVASDPKRMQRFVQEARTVSALNHPNILTVYEFGQEGETRFIATEYVDGVTLRERLRAHRMKLHEVLDIATQIAAALDAAHEAHVVHRDIKPDNIMVRRRDRIVKVLDFGLAKPVANIEAERPGIDSEAGTKVLVNTQPGVVMGTVSYMSPEQSQGAMHVDHRTDIWSLGVVLYEMIAGRVPFEGKDIHRQIIAIQEQEPPPLSRFMPAVPERLEDMVTKALAKDPLERYQTAKDLLIDLRNLKRKLEVGAEIDRTVPPEMRMRASTNSGSSMLATTSGATVAKAQAGVKPASSAEYIVTGIRHHKVATAMVLAAVVFGSVGLAAFLHARNAEGAIDSIAVLPFVNQNQDPDTEYLSEGLAESLIHRLSQLPNLKVSPTSTVFRYKGAEIDPIKVGNALGVGAVLSGRITQRGDSLAISAELVDVHNNKLLWGENYDRKTSELLATQREIAREIVDNLKLKVSPQEKALSKHYTESNEAYQSYLRGRFYWNKRTGEGLNKAVEQFQQAVDKDPTFALAYVGLADCYTLLIEYAGAPTSETAAKARAAVMRALQIDDSLGEAHTSLGLINTFSWQFGEVEKEYKRGIELNPNYPTAHHFYSTYLYLLGRLDEALVEAKLAQQLDPLSPVISDNLVYYYFLKGDLNAGIEQCRKIIELEPNYPRAHVNLGWAYLKQGREQEAMAELQKGVEVSGRGSQELGFLGYGYGALGKRAEAMTVLKELEERYGRRETPALYLAAVYAGLGEKDQAFAWLEKDFQTRTGLLVLIAWRPIYDTLRDEPRYTDLLRRMGLR